MCPNCKALHFWVGFILFTNQLDRFFSLRQTRGLQCSNWSAKSEMDVLSGLVSSASLLSDLNIHGESASLGLSHLDTKICKK